jgi:hypothetical protein
MDPMLPNLIDSFVHRHFGFGNPSGKYWLIGMEEGCGDDRAELFRRFQIWDELGQNEIDDVAEYHLRLGIPEFFQDPVKLQYTWAHLIRLVLSTESRPSDVAAVKSYQKDYLGRPDGETCLLELMPLPSPSLGIWPYGEWTGLPYLNSREEYRQTCIPWRVARLREMIRTFCPPVIVFYGTSYRMLYEQAIGYSFGQEEEGAKWAVDGDGKTLFLLVKHPAARGVNAAYFEQVGQEIRRRLTKSGLASKSAEQEPLIEMYGLYKCEQCGKMVMGYDTVRHTEHEHQKKPAGYKKLR